MSPSLICQCPGSSKFVKALHGEFLNKHVITHCYDSTWIINKNTKKASVHSKFDRLVPHLKTKYS